MSMGERLTDATRNYPSSNQNQTNSTQFNWRKNEDGGK